MAFYSVHLWGSGPDAAAGAAFVRQSFNWKAFFCGPFWLARHRLWTALLLWAAAYVILFLIWRTFLSADAIFLIAVLLQIFLGLEAAWLREEKLATEGYHLVEIIAASASDQAEIAFYRQIEPSDVIFDVASGEQGDARP
jgi:hypothetical protein